jgi:glycosyltransferase involved in cell wall biosynthesis
VKKILLITHSANITGGAEDDFERIINYLYNRNKYILFIISPLGHRFDKYKNYSNSVYCYSPGWFPVIKANILDYIKYVIIGLKQLLEIKRISKNKTFDLAIVNVSVLFFPILYLYFKKIKSIVFIRETVTDLKIRKNYYKLLSKIANYFIAVSKYNKLDFSELTNNNEIDVLYSSIESPENRLIDTNAEFIEVLGGKLYNELISANNKKILVNGNICNRKNQILALETLNILIKEHKLINLRLLLAGDYNSDKNYYSRLIKFINENNLSQNVFFLGPLKKSTIYKLYEYIDLTLITSLSEGMPLVLVESFAYKKPVISTNVGGISEIINNGENGYIIDDFSSNSFADIIIKIFQDKDLYYEMAVKCYETYKNNFDLGRNMNKLESIISKYVNI